MEIKPNEISALIKEQIKNFKTSTEYTTDVGTVITVGDGIAEIFGLRKAILGELLEFSSNSYGMVMNLEEDSVSAVLLSNKNDIKEGEKVKRTGKVVEVPVGDGLLGRVVDSLGRAIDGEGDIKFTSTRPIEFNAPSIMSRESVNSPIETGIKCIDSVIPIGKGQRELIIGDRQTGKTAIAIDTILNQKGKNVICIYVAIGQKNSSVAAIVDRLRSNDAMDYTLVVNASASEIAPLLYIAPYSGMAIAEHWMYEGKDVLIVFDDLSKHAVSYRALSLLLKRSPGREAYPGDIFYLHSRLLERSAKLNVKNGGGSITALPIVETLAGDISAYIPTNVISITDGQIFLQTDLFNAGQRPAIDTGLSVSRVGSAAQYKIMKQVSKSIKMDLANYHELLSFSQFGSDLDANTKSIINHGSIVMELLKQDQYNTLTLDREVIEIFATTRGHLDDIKVEEVKRFLNELYDYITRFDKEIIEEINTTKVLSDTLIEKLTQVITTFKAERNL